MPTIRRSWGFPRLPAASVVAVGACLLLGAAVSGCAPAAESSQSAPAVSVAPSPDVAEDPRLMVLHSDLETLAAQVPGELGFMLLDAQGVEVAAVNADQSFTSASLYKLFVALAVLEQVDQGRVELTDTVPGLGLSVDEALGQMISWSRNAPGAALGEWLGWEEIESAARAHGFTSTTFNPDSGIDGVVEMATTPADVAHFLHALNRGEMLEPSSAEVLIGYLADQHLDYALPQGLSPEVGFEHKTGLLEDVSHDAGILRLAGRDHVVAVLTDGWSGYEDSRPWFRQMGTVLDGYLHTLATATTAGTEGRASPGSGHEAMSMSTSSTCCRGT